MGRGLLRWLMPAAGVAFVLTVAAALVVLLAPPSVSHGSHGHVTVRTDDRLEFAQLAPGLGDTEEITLTTRSARPIPVRLGLRRLISRDNGCVRPERRAGDVTCAAGGELLPWLRVRLSRIDARGADAPLYIGTLAGLAARPRGIDLGKEVSSRSPLRLRMTVVPSRAMGNDTMTDSVGLTLWWSAPGAIGHLEAHANSRDPGTVAAAGHGWAFRPPAAGAAPRQPTLLSGRSGPSTPSEGGVVSQLQLLLLVAGMALVVRWLPRALLALVRPGPAGNARSRTWWSRHRDPSSAR